MSYDLSVIIPLYNTKEFISDCIDSVLNQKLKNLEIIVVDDGSTDGSLDVARMYSENFSNIKVFTQERKRQGAARNLGLKQARGEYVAFLDSDDLVPSDAYSSMVDTARDSSSDMVIGILQSFKGLRTWFGLAVHRDEFVRVIEKTSISEMPTLLSNTSACNCIIKRSLIVENGLFFPEKSSGEDLGFIVRAYLVSKAITVLPKVVYKYRAREGSRTARIDPSFFQDRVSTVLDLEKYFFDKGVANLYLFLLKLEVEKLVRNRLRRVVLECSYDVQVNIFDIILDIVSKLSDNDILYSNQFSLTTQIRLIMLKNREYDSLIAYEIPSKFRRYEDLVLSEQTKSLLFLPISKLYRMQGSKFKFVRKVAKYRGMSRLISLCKGIRKIFNLKFLNVIKDIRYKIVQILSSCLNVDKKDASVWLIDERVGASAEDNSYFFFEYLRRVHPEIPVYYVIKKDSLQRKFVDKIGNVVTQNSWEHLRLLLKARVLISNDSFRGLVYQYESFCSLLRHTHNVFLQHGVTGNKITSYTKKNHPYFSQYVVANERERGIIKNYYGFNDDEVTLTGFARFDNLSPRRSKKLSRKILVAPTWRKWLNNDSNILSSKYFSCWNEIITSPVLRDVLERYDATLYFRPHFRIMPFIDQFESGSSRIVLVRDLDEPLYRLIKDADLAITDYSSVMYDFFYQEKPVVAYMFDRYEWERMPPGPPHLTYEKEWALDIVYNSSNVFSEVEDYAKNNFQMRPNHICRLDSLFSYRDSNNCERIYKSILSKI